MLAGWAAAALLPAGPAPAPARCLNRIPVRVRRSAAGLAGQRSGRRPASAVSAGPSGASRVSVASASPLSSGLVRGGRGCGAGTSGQQREAVTCLPDNGAPRCGCRRPVLACSSIPADRDHRFRSSGQVLGLIMRPGRRRRYSPAGGRPGRPLSCYLGLVIDHRLGDVPLEWRRARFPASSSQFRSRIRAGTCGNRSARPPGTQLSCQRMLRSGCGGLSRHPSFAA